MGCFTEVHREFHGDTQRRFKRTTPAFCHPSKEENAAVAI